MCGRHKVARKQGFISHDVTIDVKVTRLEVAQRACQQLGLPAPVAYPSLYFGNLRAYLPGVEVRLPGWYSPLRLYLGAGDHAKASATHDADYASDARLMEQLFKFEEVCTEQALRLLAEETGQVLTETYEDGQKCFSFEQVVA